MFRGDGSRAQKLENTWNCLNSFVRDCSSLVFSFFSVPYLGLGSVMSGTGAASFHNLILRDGVIGVQ